MTSEIDKNTINDSSAYDNAVLNYFIKLFKT